VERVAIKIAQISSLLLAFFQKKNNGYLNSVYFKNMLMFSVFTSLFNSFIFFEPCNAQNLSVQKKSTSNITVCPTCLINKISQAILVLSPNGIITIQKGVYIEGAPLVISKPLTLRGEEGAVIDGESKYQVITVNHVDGVTIEGLKIQNSGASFIEDLSGVKVLESHNCKIINNYFLNTTYAVYLEKSENCQIQNNKIEGFALDEIKSGNGIHLWNSSDNVIEGNFVSGHRDGIYLEFSKNGLIKNNKIRKNIRYGLHFMQSNDTLYQKNIFTENGAGVAVMYSRKIKMIENKFLKNNGPSSYGLLLKDISDSFILRNEFLDNTIGIYMEGTNRSLFMNNQIRDNAWGLKIMGDCEADEFKKNNFIGNTFEVVTNSSHSLNTFKNNYWSQYDGYDFNGDGVGDKPHRPISLSSIILEKVDSAYVLLNSFFFRLIDEVERALPEMITDELIDEAPLMNEVEIKNKYD
jgi:nitrous oxidase accessory protein